MDEHLILHGHTGNLHAARQRRENVDWDRTVHVVREDREVVPDDADDPTAPLSMDDRRRLAKDVRDAMDSWNELDAEERYGTLIHIHSILTGTAEPEAPANSDVEIER